MDNFLNSGTYSDYSEYSTEDSDYSFLLFLEKSIAIIPIILYIQNISEYSAEDSDYSFFYF